MQFVARENARERLVCEADLIFGPAYPPQDGPKLTGYALWHSAEGEVCVTLPSRPFGAGGERRYFVYLRTVEGEGAVIRRY